MQQPDCTAVRADRRFGDPFGLDANEAARRYTEALREIAPTHFYPAQWALVMDLDEFLVLPKGFNDLPSYCRYLDRQGARPVAGAR